MRTGVLLAAFAACATAWAPRAALGQTVDCGGEKRRILRVEELKLNYSGQKLTATMSALRLASAQVKIEPTVLQRATDATQQWSMYLTGLATAYNYCAITREQFAAGLQRVYPVLSDDATRLTEIAQSVRSGNRASEEALRGALAKYEKDLAQVASSNRRAVAATDEIIARQKDQTAILARLEGYMRAHDSVEVFPSGPYDRKQFEDLLRKRLTATSTIRAVQENCLTFLPTEQVVREVATIRPDFGTYVWRELASAACNRVALKSWEDVQFVAEFRPDEWEMTYRSLLQGCPPDVSYDDVRDLARRLRQPGIARSIASACGIRARDRVPYAALTVGISPLNAASSMSMEGATFVGGLRVTGAAVLPVSRRFQAGVQVERAAYTMGSGTLAGLSPEGPFTMWSGTARGRYNLTCAWRHDRCGGHLETDDDVYAESSVSFNWLRGTAELSDAAVPGPPTNEAMRFRGPGVGVRLGYVRYLTRSWSASLEGGVGWVRFWSARVTAQGITNKYALSGVSTHPDLSLCVTAASPFWH